MKSCEFCSSNGFNHHLPRLNPSWKGWESQSPLDGLKMMSDEDGLYVVCNDCLVAQTFRHWSLTGIWEYQDINTR